MIFNKIMNYFKNLNNNYIINSSLHVIYIYSNFQIKYNIVMKILRNSELYKKLKMNINNIYRYYKRIREIEYITNGDVLLNFSKNNNVYLSCCNDLSFFIFSDINNYDNRINKVILKSIPQMYKYEISNVHLLLIELIIDENIYRIYLSTEQYNYYIVDNIIDKNFCLYYLKNNLYNNTINNENINEKRVILKIIDEDVNVLEIDLNKNEYLKILKDKYKINK